MTITAEQPGMSDPVFRESFQAFYRREFTAVVGLAYVLSGTRAAAEDLAQEAFIAAFRNWDRIGDYDNPGAWVRMVVARRSVSFFRRRAAEVRAVFRLGADAEQTVDPESELVWEAVRRLPSRQAQAIALRYYDRMRIADIATTLGCSENTVKTHLRRAKESLAAELQEDHR